jgi:hypothetical protein
MSNSGQGFNILETASFLDHFTPKLFGEHWHHKTNTVVFINPLAPELDIYSLAHHLCEMWIFYEPRRITLGNTRHFAEE